MLGKNRTLLLLVILVAVLALYLILQQTTDRESNFRTSLPAFDTSAIDRVVISPPGAGNPFSLDREAGTWWVDAGDKKYAADPFSVSALLTSLNGTAVRTVVAGTPDKWEPYHVNEAQATAIDYYNGNDLLSGLMLGRFEYVQPENQMPDQYGRRPQGEMLSYLRIADEDPVYVIDGMVALGTGKRTDDYRDRKLLNVKTEDLQRLEISYREGITVELEKADAGWTVDGAAADSAATAKYLNGLVNLRGKTFIDLEPAEKDLYGVLTVMTNGPEPITLKAFVQDTAGFVVLSSLNPTNLFLEDRAFLEKAFVQNDHFLGND